MDPDDYIIQRAKDWRQTEKRMIASAGEEKEKAKSAHHDAKKKLREAVDLAGRVNEEQKRKGES